MTCKMNVEDGSPSITTATATKNVKIIVLPSHSCGGTLQSFRVSGPTVWNSLPQNLRSSDISREQFKRGLKTWLFERAYV